MAKQTGVRSRKNWAARRAPLQLASQRNEEPSSADEQQKETGRQKLIDRFSTWRGKSNRKWLGWRIRTKASGPAGRIEAGLKNQCRGSHLRGLRAEENRFGRSSRKNQITQRESVHRHQREEDLTTLEFGGENKRRQKRSSLLETAATEDSGPKQRETVTPTSTWRRKPNWRSTGRKNQC
jgi:hypothetical protein